MKKVTFEYKAKIDKVVDGDTVDVVIDLGFKITTFQRIRFADIDTPEIFGVKKDSEEYKKGMAAKEFVEKRFAENQNEIFLQVLKVADKYGRYVGILWLADSETSLNDELVETGHAKYVKY